MATIKSFREYIAEKELLKEVDEVENAEETSTGTGEPPADDKANPEHSDDEKKNEDDSKSEPKKKNDGIPVFTDFDIKTTPSKSPRGKLEELKNIKDYIKNTYDALEKGIYLTAHDFNPVNWKLKEGKTASQSGTYIDLTKQNSLAKIKNEWEEANMDALKAAKSTHENAKLVSDLRKKSPLEGIKGVVSDTLDDGRSGLKNGMKKILWRGRMHSYEELLQLARDGETNLPPQILQMAKDEKEKKKAEEEKRKAENAGVEAAEAAKKFTYNGIKYFKEEEELEEGLGTLLRKAGKSINGIGRKLRDSISTTGEISSGIHNKYSSKRILTTASQHGDLYKIVDSNFLESVYKRFISSGESIISKELWSGKEYLKRAEKNIEKYYNLRYVGDDDRYLSSISRDLFRALSVATSIGYSLQALQREYKASLNKVSEEFSLRKVKDERSFKSLDTDTAIQKILNKKSKLEISNEKQTAKNKETEEQKIKDDENQQKLDVRDKEFKNLTTSIIYDKLKKYGKFSDPAEIMKRAALESAAGVKDYIKKDDTNGHLKNDYFSGDITFENNKKVRVNKGDKDKIDDKKVFTVNDQMRADALALSLILKLAEEGRLKDVINGDSARAKTRIVQSIDDLYSNALRSIDKKNPTDVIFSINNKSKNSKNFLAPDKSLNPDGVERKEKEKDANKALSGVEGNKGKIEKFNDALYQRRQRSKFGIERFNKRKQTAAKDFNGVNPAAAKDFEGGQNMGIVQYAIEKARKLNER